jgi:hypothetical protein
MSIVTFANWRIEAEAERTKRTARAIRGNPETCPCDWCNNLIVIILFIMVTLSACEDERSISLQAQNDSGVIWPLATGNTWVYKHTLVDTSRNLFDSSTVSMVVLGKDSNQTFVGYHIRDFIFWFVNPGVLLAANRTDGFYLATWGLIVPRPAPNVARGLPYPTFPGDTLTYQGLLITTQRTSTVITVPAGTFECVQFDISSNGESRGTIWASPNVGIVKTSYRVALPTDTYTLMSYQLQ